MEYTAELHDWEVVPTGSGLYYIGKIENDKKECFQNGQTIRTSLVIGEHVCKEDGYTYVHTLNSVYKLF